MTRRLLLVAALLLLPAERPADVVIEFSWGGGMRGDDTALVVSASGGSFEASLRGRTTDSFTFAVAAKDLDALYAVLRDNHLEKIRCEKGLVHDKPGHSITVRAKGVNVHLGTSGHMIEEKWEVEYATIVKALTTYQEKIASARRAPLHLVIDESLAKKSYTVLLGDDLVMARVAEPTDLPVARALVHVGRGAHTLTVTVDGKETRHDFKLPGPKTLVVSAKGEDVSVQPSDKEDPAIIRIDAATAAKRGLPRVSIELDTSMAGFMRDPNPAAGTFLHLSGPPGGPLGLSLEVYKDTVATVSSLEALAAKRFADRTFAKGSPDTVNVGGALVTGITCATDTSHAKSLHLLALVPATPGADHGVLVDFWTSHGTGATLSPSELMKLEPWGDLIRSLRILHESD